VPLRDHSKIRKSHPFRLGTFPESYVLRHRCRVSSQERNRTKSPESLALQVSEPDCGLERPISTPVTATLPILSLALFLLTSCAGPTRKPTDPEGAKTLTVMSFNVNYGLAGDSEAIEVIRQTSADLVLLQETTVAWETQIRRDLGREYPHMAFRHCCGAGGLAILSKGRLLQEEYLAPRTRERGWFPAWRHTVETPLGKVQTLNVHLRPPISDGGSVIRGYFSTRSVRKKEIRAHVAELDPGIPTVIAGDFNESEDGRAVQFLDKRGLRSALPEFKPGADTWRWTTSMGTVHSQLDHIVYDPHFTPINATVLKQGKSDHWPVVATFVLSD
jgi:endonuclease/exonuclease/phosphatase (EEP) superfamily protein YafD